jgi:hypothetical protein
MASSDGNVRMRIVALHVRQNGVTQARADTVLSAVGDTHISTTTPVRIPTVCRQNWTAVVGYRSGGPTGATHPTDPC